MCGRGIDPFPSLFSDTGSSHKARLMMPGVFLQERMKPRSFFSTPHWMALLVLCAALAPLVLSALARRDLPMTLGPLALVQEVGGTDARLLVGQMHGKDVGMGENRVGFYASRSGRAALYRTLFSSREGAESSGRAMADRIVQGNPVFSHYRAITLDDRLVSMCIGFGQVHFFYTDGRCLSWLAVDASVAEPAILSLLRHDHQLWIPWE